MRTSPHVLPLALIAGLAITLAACTGSSSPDAETRTITGSVAPVTEGASSADWTVTAWQAGEGEPEVVAEASADDDGAFSIDVADAGESVAYLTAESSSGDATLAVAVADLSQTSKVTLNERTTVAAAYALAQFVEAEGITGPSPGLDNAAAMAATLADPASGDYGDVLTTAPNGNETSTLPAFTSLTDMLGACIVDDENCSRLTDAAGVDAGADALQTFAAIARDPSADPEALFEIAAAEAGDRPGLSAAPAAWTLTLLFDGGGDQLAGPGNFAIDPEGNIWVNNNYEYNADPQTPVCGSDQMFKFSPTGELLETYSGGGLSGSGYGIEFDATGDIWLSNFGFAAPAPGCPDDEQPPHNSMSLFAYDGTAISSDTGYTEGDLSWPQGIEVAGDGGVWIANCGNDTVSLYPEGDPEQGVNLGSMGLEQPFDVVDNGERIFVTGTVNSTVAVAERDGTPIEGSPLTGSFDRPMGAAVDADGNVWISNSGGITLPCPERVADGRGTPSVVMISPDGTTVSEPYTGGGLTLPWGIATDGDGNVWAANFEEQRISHFCGVNADTCPRGLQTGDAISPEDTGYSFDGLQRSTGITVDPSGNVWTTNNWKTAAVQTNPGGHQIVAYIGAAAPVAVAPFE
ncbi:NHL repeat-containing protein [Microbacterium sp. LRZ72]|uniref:NHL repeat-containing protein n=1 Tax=Microbacterium sp. LRZ72 TaxID=2942481 RepID=UPI0029A65EB3|nr:NHL repeat-containing protein [Microbacterium sp. LRZ72]MDX2376960.1 NHL repeat-containing protein [Microbacterium sp. LRZ72]